MVTLVAAAGAARLVVRAPVAGFLARPEAGVRGAQRALAWNRRDPDLHLRLGRALAISLDHPDPIRARQHLETALRLRPADARIWLELALASEHRGERDRARAALATALRLDSHDVGLRWEAALLALRWGDQPAALEHLGYVLLVDPKRRDAAFQLAHALTGPGQSLAEILPAEAPALTVLLEAALHHRDLALAQTVWTRRAPLTPAVPDGLRRQYVEALLNADEGMAARRVWNGMMDGGHLDGETDAVWNGGFETRGFVGWGFDWQVQHVWGVRVGIDPATAAEGRQSLRLTFNAPPDLDFAGVSERVAVEPDRTYRLRARVRADDFETRSGLKLQVIAPDGAVLGETTPVAGTFEEWRPLEARVRVPAGVSLVRVRLRRERAREPEPPLGGRVWVDAVSLVRVGERG